MTAVAPVPPRVAERLLRAVIRSVAWREAVLGDLAEEFPVLAGRAGVRTAQAWYSRQALGIGARLLAGTAGAADGASPALCGS